MSTRETVFSKDLPNKKITVLRSFGAPLPQVWSAWTESELLDQWWAPRPYRAETKSMDFREGGTWLYCMVGPEGDSSWCRADYQTIESQKHFMNSTGFCNEEGIPVSDFPKMYMTNLFNETDEETTVKVEITYDQISDMETYLEMGFQEGFTAALSNLDQYLSEQFKLRKEMKTSGSRVTTYLNFPGNTEEALLFYKDVFNGEFSGRGLTRFGDTPMPDGVPPMSESDKKLILHAELIILGGHVLMATDSPESMGFKLNQGNNMHINLEAETREETKRIFDALSAGGVVTMPLQDMFWGAYYGSFTDKYGVNWMLNHQNR